MKYSPVFIGIDCGTSGVRAIAIDANGKVIAESSFLMTEFSDNLRSPKTWQTTFQSALNALLLIINRDSVQAICVDGTSGTMLPIDISGNPLAQGKMYNDACDDKSILTTIANHAPRESGAHGATSGLAKAIEFQQKSRCHKIIHQADWLAGNLCAVYSSDTNNALKTGYDPILKCWPDWISATGMNLELLPDVLDPGTPIANISPQTALRLGLNKKVTIVAGTTDSCASVLATGARKTGDGVSVLGTSLAIKLLSDEPIFDPPSGVYSHALLDKWLVGGASNTGGNVLLKYFSIAEIVNLSKLINPETETGLDYYPLASPGERFPISDPDLSPRLVPKPETRLEFLKAMLEGMAQIEARGYAKLAQLGAPELNCVRTIGGGANNDTWTSIRERKLKVKMRPSISSQAAYGAARLARIGAAI